MVKGVNFMCILPLLKIKILLTFCVFLHIKEIFIKNLVLIEKFKEEKTYLGYYI